jgi:hypothetical protein
VQTVLQMPPVILGTAGKNAVDQWNKSGRNAGTSVCQFKELRAKSREACIHRDLLLVLTVSKHRTSPASSTRSI